MKTKRILLSSLISTITFLVSNSSAVAQNFTANYSAYNSKLQNRFASASLGTILSELLVYLLPLAGLILFGMLLAGGFTMLSGAASKDSQEKGKSMVTSALIGFGIIFAAYWIAQVLQVIFKVSIVTP